MIIQRKKKLFKVYWMGLDEDPYCRDYTELTDALAATRDLRNMGRTFVTMVSEDPNSVGKPGVDEITEGILPDGEEYTWRKRR